MRTRHTAIAMLSAAFVAMFSGEAVSQDSPPVLVNGNPTDEDYVNTEFIVSDLLRRARPTDDITAWVRPAVPALARLGLSPDELDSVPVLLEIDAAGDVSRCSLELEDPDARLERILCEHIAARARLIPALDQSGARVEDQYEMTVSVFFGEPPEWASDGPTPRLSMRAGWPTRESQGRITDATGIPRLAGGPDSPEALSEAFAGVALRLDEGNVRCMVFARSRDEAFDRRACEAAMRGRYDFSGTEPNARLFIHFVNQGGSPAALLPVNNERTTPTPLDESVTAIQRNLTESTLEKVRLDIVVDRRGRVDACAIAETSGDDQQDHAACTATMALGSFKPAQDIFGRPTWFKIFDWRPMSGNTGGPAN